MTNVVFVFQALFSFQHEDYEKQLTRLLVRKDNKTGLIINNPAQSMFLFVDRQHVDVGITIILCFADM